ncbi:DoxX family protein [Leucobacter sp. CSA2]|uniref:DoxX family protein n=1 Tax=Leucobacter edaphi TaxID=2796472 RepID=A0A934UXB5_9MICO|nr:DoxX family protein [Leucobacter edaphi]MBK0421143.1 DoxX family protein [Leucobacter edaphi]
MTNETHPTTRISLGLLILRVAAGVIFAAHGGQKLFEFTIPGTTASFEDMGVPAAGLIAPAIAILEFVGGILLALGGLTRIVALLLTLDMLGAIVTVHAPLGFWVQSGGIEFVALLGAAALALAAAGAGRISLDHLLLRKALPDILVG